MEKQIIADGNSENLLKQAEEISSRARDEFDKMIRNTKQGQSE
jgi:hypothetical protein